MDKSIGTGVITIKTTLYYNGKDWNAYGDKSQQRATVELPEGYKVANVYGLPAVVDEIGMKAVLRGSASQITANGKELRRV